MGKLTVGSCFSGIGGLELGLEWTGGFETKWQIENDEYASRVLAKHWPGVKRYGDILGVSFPDRVDLICGGFPCQDVSLAGARSGLKGKRSTLWGEMFRLVCEVKPRSRRKSAK
jgi:DNA (cytosine-5)-methyltransferase 1